MKNHSILSLLLIILLLGGIFLPIASIFSSCSLETKELPSGDEQVNSEEATELVTNLEMLETEFHESEFQSEAITSPVNVHMAGWYAVAVHDDGSFTVVMTKDGEQRTYQKKNTTLKDFARVEPGMTLFDVVAICGMPALVESTTGRMSNIFSTTDESRCRCRIYWSYDSDKETYVVDELVY